MASAETTQEQTGLGNYFVANYPPFSFWKPTYLPQALEALHTSPRPGTPLGLYLHIPFCRKRCKFCYFRVYTDKNARDVDTYLDALVREIELYSQLSVVGGRPLLYVYFGGGTPSFLSATQLRSLIGRIQQFLPWHGAEEVTFECEPGTLQQHKLAALREMGITRLSLGIENFNDRILEENGRAHLSAEIYRAYAWARDLQFDQINIDLIAGMVGETWENWRECVRKTAELSPDSVTIYQMELPFNTVYSKELRIIGQDSPGTASVADWPTKRAWVQYAFDELGKAGYEVSSAYTVVKDRRRCRFVYRDGLWHGADMFGTGVASFGHANGVHMQNVDSWEQYVGMLDKGELPLNRALPVQPRELLIREMILQLKTGRLDLSYFRSKFGSDPAKDFPQEFGQLAQEGFLSLGEESIELTQAGLLQVDRLLPIFFEPEHRGTRYT
ncbi:MAG TPA: coproporphyrinogen-III oxidase family protein [Gemmataceae bacterium]|nr:coproporphyrinogen-III oxidase family protein [Gemmataceae bacterium]